MKIFIIGGKAKTGKNTLGEYIKEELKNQGITKVDGILFDLGVSSVQLDEAERGFSFHNDAFLDMRMNKKQELSAYKVVNEYSLKDLIRIFRDYGEEKYAVGIANKIVDYIIGNTKEEYFIDTFIENGVIKGEVIDEKNKASDGCAAVGADGVFGIHHAERVRCGNR